MYYALAQAAEEELRVAGVSRQESVGIHRNQLPGHINARLYPRIRYVVAVLAIPDDLKTIVDRIAADLRATRQEYAACDSPDVDRAVAVLGEVNPVVIAAGKTILERLLLGELVLASRSEEHTSELQSPC